MWSAIEEVVEPLIRNGQFDVGGIAVGDFACVWDLVFLAWVAHRERVQAIASRRSDRDE